MLKFQSQMKSYRKAFFENRRFSSDKWEHYFEIYDHLLKHLYDTDINFVEIGVQNGGSLEIARNLFGSQSKIIGIDIDPSCKHLETAGVASKIIIGSQVEDRCLNELIDVTAEIDVVIDDGSHIQSHMIATFIKLFPHVKQNGIYIIEDTHTNFSPEHQESFFGIGLYDYFKGISERLNIDYLDSSKRRGLYKTQREDRVNDPRIIDITHDIFSIEFFDSLIAIKKRTRLAPLRIRK